jgi:hypothetical protein
MTAYGFYKKGKLVGFCTDLKYARKYVELFRYEMREIEINEK